uniref:Uncharacterized protein n=1 Tax=Anguilla anguilla TaxID=7936 RepID=A0A0E9SQY2_ANGAN
MCEAKTKQCTQHLQIYPKCLNYALL